MGPFCDAENSSIHDGTDSDETDADGGDDEEDDDDEDDDDEDDDEDDDDEEDWLATSSGSLCGGFLHCGVGVFLEHVDWLVELSNIRFTRLPDGLRNTVLLPPSIGDSGATDISSGSAWGGASGVTPSGPSATITTGDRGYSTISTEPVAFVGGSRKKLGSSTSGTD